MGTARVIAGLQLASLKAMTHSLSLFFADCPHGARTILIGLLCAPSLSCASQGGARNPDREKIIPEETQRESEQLQGEQQIFMSDLNSTTSEQAGVRHEEAVQSVRNPERENGAGKK